MTNWSFTETWDQWSESFTERPDKELSFTDDFDTPDFDIGLYLSDPTTMPALPLKVEMFGSWIYKVRLVEATEEVD